MSDFVPDEFLTLSDAVDYAGRRLFQPDWTGREIRQLRRPPPKRTLRRLERAIGELRNLMASKHVQPIALANNGERFQGLSAPCRFAHRMAAFGHKRTFIITPQPRVRGLVAAGTRSSMNLMSSLSSRAKLIHSWTDSDSQTAVTKY